MIDVCFQTYWMPVRILIQVALTALTRPLIEIINANHAVEWPIIVVTGSIVFLAIGILILKLDPYKYPSSREDDERDFGEVAT